MKASAVQSSLRGEWVVNLMMSKDLISMDKGTNKRAENKIKQVFIFFLEREYFRRSQRYE